MHYLLTGASSGIGRAFLELLLKQAAATPASSAAAYTAASTPAEAPAAAPAEDPAVSPSAGVAPPNLSLTVLSRSASKLHEVQSLCAPYPCRGLCLDLTQPELIQPQLTELLAAAPPVDRVVYCAGMTRIEAVTKLRYAQNLAMMNLSYLSLVELLRVLIAHKSVEHQIKVVVVSALAATTGAEHTVSYSTAKQALETFVRHGAPELLAENVWINALAPAYVDTPMLKFNRLIDRNFATNVRKIQPLGLLSPQAVAHELAALLESTCCTGTIRYVNGGMRY